MKGGDMNSVSDDVITGKFSINLAALKAGILSPDRDEFPERPEYSYFQITGNFTVVFGDFKDLLKARHDLIRNAIEAYF
jgi:hypothetical protein